MRKNIFYSLIFGILTLSSLISRAQLPQVKLTDNAKVSLLTCSQGNELYSIFGHSAIRISDTTIGVDWVFNYGTFDFSEPNFYVNFVRGKLNYILSASTYRNFEYSYVLEDRFIYEQVLNLNSDEKQLLLDSLKTNYKPENRYYLYDFLFDNCATRIRDIFVESIPRDITFDYSALDQSKSFRDLLIPNVEEKPWAKLGINLLLGVSADRPARPWEQMFLPEHMLTAFKYATIESDNGNIPLMQAPTLILKGDEIPKSKLKNGPILAFTILLLSAVAVSYINIKKQRPLWWFDRTLFALVGLLGLVIAFQWFGSDHAVMANNYNLIWAHPIHLLAAIFITSSKLKSVMRLYFGLNTALMVVLLATWFFLPQTLPLPMLPVVAALGLRSATLYKRLN